MGRFYKTAKPTFVDDAMYQAPHELMLNALQSQDKLLNDQKATLDEFDTMGDLLDFVDKDKDARTQALEGHRQKALELTEKINENPALYSAYIGEINKAKRAFNEDIKTGSLFEMDRAAKRRAALIEKINKREGISETARNEAILKIDRDYQGVGKSNFAEDIHIYDELDEGQFQKDLKTTVAVNGVGTTTKKPDGKGYFIQNGETKTYITEDRLRGIVTSDPAVEDWKREQLQTLERQLERGQFTDRAEMETVYNKRYNDFVQNTIDKLAFEKIQTEDDVYSVDSKRVADFNRWESARKFDVAQKERIGNNFITEIDANIDEISDEEVDNLFVPPLTESVTFGPLTKDGKGLDFTVNMSAAEKRQYLNTERQNLEQALAKTGDNLNTFRDKMLTPQGRAELAKSTGMTFDELSRQANYKKSYNLKTPTVPDYSENDLQKVQEQKQYMETTKKGLNQFLVTTPVQIDIVNPEGKRERKTMTIAQAHEAGHLLNSTNTQTVPGDPLRDANGAYIGVDGEPLTKVTEVDDDGNALKVAPMTLEEIEESGASVKRGKDKKVPVRDTSKPLLDVKEEEIFETTEVKYDGARRPRKTDYYTVTKTVPAPDGVGTNQVIVYIKKQDVDIEKQTKK